MKNDGEYICLSWGYDDSIFFKGHNLKNEDFDPEGFEMLPFHKFGIYPSIYELTTKELWDLIEKYFIIIRKEKYARWGIGTDDDGEKKGFFYCPSNPGRGAFKVTEITYTYLEKPIKKEGSYW